MDHEIILQCLDNNIIPDLILFEDIQLSLTRNGVRNKTDLIDRINEIDELVIIDDVAEFQYEEGNKLIIKKELLKYV